jgi:hypothetical protein
MTALCCGFAAFALGVAVQLNDGALSPGAILWLTMALLALLLAPVWRRELSGRAVAAALATGCAVEGLLLFTRPPGIYLEPGPGGPWPYWAGVALLCALALLSAREKRAFPFLLAVHFALGVWVLRASPNPLIDVVTFQREAIDHALRGHNPYAMTFSDPYGGRFPFYGEGLLQNGRVLVGYPYPPLCLALGIAAQVIAGDYRFAVLASITAAAACIALARPGRVARLAAALLLLSPRGFFVVEQGWTDPYVLALGCAVVLCAIRFRRALPWVLGAFFAVKQYAVLAAPLLLLVEKRPWRLLLHAAIFAGALTLPFALLDLRAFIDDVVRFQMRQPFRPDSLSFSAWSRAVGGPVLPGWISFLALAAAIALSLAARAPFAAALALSFCAFFAVGKQAFCNYYFFVLGLAACAAGVIPPVSESHHIAASSPAAPKAASPGG